MEVNGTNTEVNTWEWGKLETLVTIIIIIEDKCKRRFVFI